MIVAWLRIQQHKLIHLVWYRLPPTIINSVPVIGLQRIEVLRDDASAFYGSEAVGGAVNMTLDDDYEGLGTGLKYGLTPGTGYDEKTFHIKAGTTFDNGQTNIGFDGVYTDRGTLKTGDNAFSTNSDLRPLRVRIDYEGDTQFQNNNGNTA